MIDSEAAVVTGFSILPTSCGQVCVVFKICMSNVTVLDLLTDIAAARISVRSPSSEQVLSNSIPNSIVVKHCAS